MDWKEQLQQVYKTMQHKAKHERPKDKFDLEANYKGRKGYSKNKKIDPCMQQELQPNTGLQVVN